MQTILASLIVGAVFGFMIWQKLKRRKAFWTGELVDKYTRERLRDNRNKSNRSISYGLGSNDRDVQISYFFKIRTDNGKIFEWSVNQGIYEGFRVGDKLQKLPGSEMPSILNPTEVNRVVEEQKQAEEENR